MARFLFSLLVLLLFLTGGMIRPAVASVTGGPGWSIVGEEDFNGDSIPDILWTNQKTGEAVIWYMLGHTIISEQVLRIPARSKIVGIVDFDGDGHPDIIIQEWPSGFSEVWSLNGASVIDRHRIDSVPSEHRISGIWDSRRHGEIEFVLRNTKTGEIVLSSLKAGKLDGITRIPGPVLSWEIKTIRDFNGDGTPDILWRNCLSGAVDIWFMDGVNRIFPDAVSARSPPLNLVEACLPDAFELPVGTFDVARVYDHLLLLTESFHTCLVSRNSDIRAPPANLPLSRSF